MHQKTLNRLVRFIDQFKEMNFANDTVMEAQLESVRKELLSKTAEEYRDSAHARQRLSQGLSQLADHARQLARARIHGNWYSEFGEMEQKESSRLATDKKGHSDTTQSARLFLTRVVAHSKAPIVPFRPDAFSLDMLFDAHRQAFKIGIDYRQ